MSVPNPRVDLPPARPLQAHLDVLAGGAGRAEPRPAPGAGRVWPWAVGFIVVAVLLAAGWYRMRAPQPATTPVPAAPVAAVAPPPMAAVGAIDASGYVAARRQATVSAESTGRVIHIAVHSGSTVKRGQVLAEVAAEIPKAEVEFSEAQVQAARSVLAVGESRVAEARRALERTRELAAQGFVSASQVDTARFNLSTLEAQLQASRADVTTAQVRTDVQRRQLATTQIRAPFDGLVTELTAQEGEIVSPMSASGGFTRSGICTIVDMASLEVEANVNEEHLSRLRVGSPVTVKARAWPQIEMHGHLAEITSAVARDTGAVKVRIALDPIDPHLLPGMRVEVSIAAPLKAKP